MDISEAQKLSAFPLAGGNTKKCSAPDHPDLTHRADSGEVDAMLSMYKFWKEDENTPLEKREKGFLYLLTAAEKGNTFAQNELPKATLEMAKLYKDGGDLIACLSLLSAVGQTHQSETKAFLLELWNTNKEEMQLLTKAKALSEFSSLKEKYEGKQRPQKEDAVLLALGYLFVEKNVDRAIDLALGAFCSAAMLPRILSDKPLPFVHKNPRKAEKSTVLYEKARALMRAGGRAKEIYLLLAKAESLGNMLANQDLCYDFYLEVPWRYSGRLGLDKNHPYSREYKLFKIRSCWYHLATCFHMAKQKDPLSCCLLAERLVEGKKTVEFLYKDDQKDVPVQPALSYLFRTIAAYIYYERYEKEKDIHALAVLITRHAQYLHISPERFEELCQTPALLSYGLYWFYLAEQAQDYEDKMYCAAKAEENGAGAEHYYRSKSKQADLYLAKMEREEKQKEEARRRKLQEAMWAERDAAYRRIASQFEEKERAFNFFTSGNMATEDEMRFLGKRDPTEHDLYSFWKDKKIRDLLNKK